MDVILSPIRSRYLQENGMINICPYIGLYQEVNSELELDEAIKICRSLKEPINLVFNDFIYRDKPKIDFSLLTKDITITTISAIDYSFYGNIYREIFNYLPYCNLNLIYCTSLNNEKVNDLILKTQMLISDSFEYYNNLNFIKLVTKPKDESYLQELRILRRNINILCFDEYTYYYYYLRNFPVYKRIRKVLLPDGRVMLYDIITRRYKLLYDVSHYVDYDYQKDEGHIYQQVENSNW